MKKVYSGTADLPLVECLNANKSKYVVRWGVCEVPSDREGKEYTYLTQEYTHKPTISDIKDAILGSINSETDAMILQGYVWKDMPVWLSTENQFNYKSEHDEAVLTGGTNLPVTFKFGTTEAPVYYEFTELDELKSFYKGASDYVKQCLMQGWQRKDGFDFAPYESALENL